MYAVKNNIGMNVSDENCKCEVKISPFIRFIHLIELDASEAPKFSGNHSMPRTAFKQKQSKVRFFIVK